mgnify:CR=1 FL=1|tara:strand:- start:3264 stop:3611 length:348 start_codon:yes stop_codon:yes gene_type:complete
MLKIIHNPRCRKSREALKLLNERRLSPIVIEYLKSPLGKKQIEELISLLKKSDVDKIIRKNESIYKEKYKNKILSKSDIVEVLIAHPILLERPIVVKDKKAIIGRPPENILDLLK